MTVINIRGTGGSGKSTVVRRIMDLYPVKTPDMREGRRRRYGTWLGDVTESDLLFVPGHYDTACGGCDTIKTVDEVYNLVRDALEAGCSVLYEGIMVQDDVRRAVELDKALKARGPDGLHVILLSTPIEECLAAIRARRAEAGNEKPLNEKNTRGRYETQLRIRGRLRDAGVSVERLDREAAFLRVAELLGRSP